ncbi:MAG: hypothetical protein GW942_00870 [Candidatus Pacebacteria bacterium]|nr:hypothetical protein [Candidatus Paceibacterota bacterium]
MSEKHPLTIYYTGMSERRTLALNQIPDVQAVKNFDGGPEEDTADVMSIMWDKVAYAFPRVIEDAGGYLNGHAVIAADARTSILVPVRDTQSVLESKGKPKDDEAIFENFSRMALIANEMGFGHYQLISASGVVTKNQRVQDLDRVEVDISKKGLDHLSTPNGYDEYLAAFLDFYSSGEYSANHLSAIGPSKISGGISLPVLRSMGIVERVNGVEQVDTSKEAYEAFRLGLLTVAVGFGPNVLGKVNPDAMARLLQWDWLNQVSRKVTKYAQD